MKEKSIEQHKLVAQLLEALRVAREPLLEEACDDLRSNLLAKLQMEIGEALVIASHFLVDDCHWDGEKIERVKKFPKYLRQAYRSYMSVPPEIRNGTYEEAYKWIAEESKCSEFTVSELFGYKLPAPDTWEKYVRKVLSELGESKNQPDEVHSIGYEKGCKESANCAYISGYKRGQEDAMEGRPIGGELT